MYLDASASYFRRFAYCGASGCVRPCANFCMRACRFVDLQWVGESWGLFFVWSHSSLASSAAGCFISAVYTREIDTCIPSDIMELKKQYA